MSWRLWHDEEKNERQIIRMLGKIIVILTSFPYSFVSFFFSFWFLNIRITWICWGWHGMPSHRGGRHDHFSSRQWIYCSIYTSLIYIYIYIFSYIVSVNSERNTWLTSFLFLIKCRVFLSEEIFPSFGYVFKCDSFREVINNLRSLYSTKDA